MKRLLALLLVIGAPYALALDVEGYVFAPDGVLVKNATVSIYAPAPKAAERKALQSATSEDGHFKFEGLPESLLDVEVKAEGFAPVSVVAIPNDPPLTITLRRDPPTRAMREMEAARAARIGAREMPKGGDRTIGGTIRLGKKPLAGVLVFLHSLSDGHLASVTAVTDANGRYRAAGLPAARYAVAIAPGLESRLRVPWTGRMWEGGREPNLVDVTEQKSGTFDVDLTLVPLVTGRVTDHENKPVVGAEVRAFLEDMGAQHAFDELPWVARTIAGGRYAVPAPEYERERPVQLLVARAGHSIVRSKSFTLTGGAQQVDMKLPRFDPLTVRVLGPDKQPIANARLSFVSAEEMPAYETTGMALHRPDRTRATDANGEVVLLLQPGEYTLAAAAERFQSRSVTAKAPARATSIDIVLERAASIRGRVRRGDAGVGGVLVMIAEDRRGYSTHTASDGTFELDGLAAGRHRVLIMKPDEMIDRTMEVAAPATLDVELPPSGIVRGRVIDGASRKAVEQFLYSLEPLETTQSTMRRGFESRGSQNADGTFTANVPVGRYRLVISAPNYRRSDTTELAVTQEKPFDVEIALDRGAVVSGRVLDESGAPVREATVWTMVEEPEHERARSSVSARHPRPSNATTDASGAFTLSGLEPGPVTVVVRKEGYVGLKKTVDASATTRIDLTLTRGLSISGVVLHNDRPVADAQVGASTAAADAEQQMAITDGEGRFTLTGLVPVRYWLQAFKEGVGQNEVQNIDPSRQREVTIRLDAQQRATIHGTVGGIATAGGKLMRRVVFAHGQNHGAEGTIDDAGRYRIENAPTGAVQVIATVEWSSGETQTARREAEVAVGATVQVDLDLAGGLPVRGRVTQEGQPLANVRVVFGAGDGAMMGGAQTREDGTYELTVPRRGIYNIYVHGGRTRATLSMRREVRGNDTIDIELRERTVTGMVVDAETGQAIADAMVTLDAEVVAPGSESIAAQTITDAAGRFSFLTSATGPHRIYASARGYAHSIQRLDFGGGEIASLRFALARAGELRVRVFDARTKTQLNAHVTIADARGVALAVPPRHVPADATIAFWLAPGRYRITAMVQGYTTKSVEVTAPGVVELAME